MDHWEATTMKSRIYQSLALLGAFVLGLLCVRPAAQALESLAISTCKRPSACSAAVNTSKSKTSIGVAGIATHGLGLAGISGAIPTPNPAGAGTGVYGSGPANGVVGVSAAGIGITGIAGAPPSGTASGVGVFGSGANYGVSGVSTTAGVGARSFGTSADVAAVEAGAASGASIFIGQGAGTSQIAIDPNANIQTTGKLYTAGSCSTGCIVRRVVSYGTTAASPTLEDTGEAQLRAGVAVVRLDPSFANAIDPHQNYLVLITPEGVTAGLYVTQRTQTGFVVRENPGGHSDAAFAYRVVARPFGSREPRLPFVELHRATNL
jgi:hypothetical protein